PPAPDTRARAGAPWPAPSSSPLPPTRGRRQPQPRPPLSARRSPAVDDHLHPSRLEAAVARAQPLPPRSFDPHPQPGRLGPPAPAGGLQHQKDAPPLPDARRQPAGVG